ncbi:MAG: HSP90 family protein [Propionibacteriaceae bacterium]|jgi:molecular chaperone HtpG|nr:HSP90 family protein [Propionibacteriaceae bacterium]
MVSPQSRPFQVDLRGVVDLLSRHIYSSPRVYLRELLQNGVDAITARKALPAEAANDAGRSGSLAPAIRIFPINDQREEFVLSDDGIGLTEDEVTELLATVGRSSKRDIFDLPRSDYLGQFGIGLLSCFMVSDAIRIVSRSAKGGPGVEWVGDANGTFTVRTLADAPIGTSVRLKPRFDSKDLLSQPTVLRLAKEFGEFLPVPVYVDLPHDSERINRDPVFLDPDPDFGELYQFGTELIGARPLDVINISAPATGTRGKAFVLPFAPPPNARQSSRVYLGRMLLSERADGLLPDWAFFVRPVLDSTDLSPTASREGVVEDFRLEHTREELGNAIRRWLVELTLSDPRRLGQFLAIHEAALKQLVLHDEELAGFVMRFLSVETSLGRMTIERLTKTYKTIRYTETVDEFRQVVAVIRDDVPLVNGGYIHDTELVRMLPGRYDVAVERVNVLAILDHLDPPPLDDRSIAVELEERATRVLTGRDCQVVVRIMDQPDTPALYVADLDVFRHLDRTRAGELSSPLWSKLISQVDERMTAERSAKIGDAAARLCLNWGNPLIRMLARTTDDEVFASSLQVLYAQSQLAGHQPLTSQDRRLLYSALTDLVALRVNAETDIFADFE